MLQTPVLNIPIVEYLDLENLSEIPKVVEKVKPHGPIDILINNAGISYRGEVAETDISVHLKMMLTNHLGQVALTQGIYHIF